VQNERAQSNSFKKTSSEEKIEREKREKKKKTFVFLKVRCLHTTC